MTDKACKNCRHFDLRAAHQCRERRAEPVDDKGLANFCEYFEWAGREWTGAAADPRVIPVLRARVGDPTTEEGRALLEAASPLNHAGDIKVPLAKINKQ